ncbi:hypothetical protein IRJ41_020432 [Triplophysa rosa]|uniref:Uncharacterized protein n=1 Tax=Triplophysa rosa TaxID=992332 RepID=A0A9W7TSX6_TRIRA|nr:hypothetical protein IRJ41_020432 [Triplophysa rosa]
MALHFHPDVLLTRHQRQSPVTPFIPTQQNLVSSRVELSAQWFAVPHVLGTSSAQVRPLHHQISQPVQTDADGERGDETVKPSQDDTQRPAQNQQNHQPDDGPETRATRGHSQLQRLQKRTHKRVTYSEVS